MAVLLGVAFLAGLVTALSPCVLPVLPILLAGGASGSRSRPYAIVVGLVASFTVVTLAGAALLDALGLPEDLLRDLGIAMLFVVAAVLALPRLGYLLERPLLRLTRSPVIRDGGGLVLGLSLGVVFVPCAGPVLATVSVLAASSDVSGRLVATTVAYASGAAVPMLAIAVAGRRAARAFRSPRLRPVLAGVVALTALAIALGADRPFQTAVPAYTEALQDRFERSAAAERQLARLTGTRAHEESTLRDYGAAPELRGLDHWLNSAPRSLASLRGRVVVLDFWTYSCVNCLRTLPYLKRWDAAYRADGLTILGVHAPEFAFERVPGNVRDAVRELGIRYPVALDNGFATWNAYANRYWPAKYVIDRRGRLRFVHFGEGEYARTEAVIRRLLAEDGRELRRTRTVADPRPTAFATMTPETYLGYARLDRYAGSPLRPDRFATYALPAAPLRRDHVALAGRWRVEAERAVAGSGARLRLRFGAREVNLVLDGRGRVDVLLDGERRAPVLVDGPRMYRLLSLPRPVDGVLEVRPAAGVGAYAFTFGG